MIVYCDSGTIFEAFVPPEGDGVASLLSGKVSNLLCGRLLESGRISFSFSFSVPKMLICAGFGHFRLRPKMLLHFRFRFRFQCKLRTNAEIHSSSDCWPVQTGRQIVYSG